MRAACLGEAMIEMAPVGAGLFRQAVAGDVFNTAVYLKQELGELAEVAFHTGVGDDAFSEMVLAEVRRRGLDDRGCRRVPGGQPGLYVIEVDAAGDRSFHYWRRTSAARRWFSELKRDGGAARLDGCDLVYLSGVSLAILEPGEWREAVDLLQALSGRVGLLAFDPNVRPKLWPDLSAARRTMEAACAASDIVLPSQVDGELLWGEADPRRQAERYLGLGAREVAITCGADGAWVFAPGAAAHVAARAGAVVDTSGAGDAFNGAYLAGRLQDAPPPQAAAAGQRLAAAVVARPGALPQID